MKIRPIEPRDDPAVAAIIRAVMPEFGAKGPGFAINDPEVDFMSRAYGRPGAAYFVIEREPGDGPGAGRVVGGAGIAPLEGGDAVTCELRKMYFLPEARGQGLGEALLRRCLTVARALGYERCYLETLENMKAARRLYERSGFQRLCGPLGATGHFSCDTWYALDLTHAALDG